MLLRKCFRELGQLGSLALMTVWVTAAGAAEPPGGQSVETDKEEGVTETAKPAQPLFTYRTDFGTVIDGGAKRQGIWNGNLLIGGQFDLERLARVKGAKVLVQGSATHGRNFSSVVGDAQLSSNIEGPQALTLYQAWWNQSFLQDRLSVLAGVHDLSTEFYVTDASSAFLNSGFGTGTELSMSGRNGPSVFPATGLAAIVRAQPVSSVRVRAGLYDGVPGNAEDPRRTSIGIKKDDGFLGVGEVGYEYAIAAQKGVVSLGAWRFTRRQPHLVDVDKIVNQDGEEEDGPARLVASQGMYLTLNQKLFSEVEGLDLGLSGFLRVGLAAENGASPVTKSLAGGLSYLGLFDSREEDVTSLGVSLARIGRAGFAARKDEFGLAPHRLEAAVELTYKYQAYSWLAVQPDLQWIIQPGFNPDLRDAVVGATRVELSL